MFDQDDLLPISALQHLLFCERQCALIHIEREWVENRFTVEGRGLHRKAHEGPDETRDHAHVSRGLSLRSLRLGLIGQADVVEFHSDPMGGPAIAFPIEYKRGKPKSHEADRVQLCAQALCLEEILGTSVPCGALYYGRTRRRRDVEFDSALRELTERSCARLHEMIAAGVTPRAVREPKCDRCSLLSICLPDALAPRRTASRYLSRALADSLGDTSAGCA